MGLVLRSLSERIITGFIIAWIASHQAQLAGSENQLPTIAVLAFLLFPVTWAKEALITVTSVQYGKLKRFLVILLEFISTGFLWILISIVSNLYNESLKPFANLDAMYRTIVGIIIVCGIVMMIEDSPPVKVKKTKEVKTE